MGWSVIQLCQMAAVRARRRCGDADEDAARCACRVLFEVELALEGVDDRFDPLPDVGEVAGSGGFVAAGGAQQADAEVIAREALELAPGEALVAEEYLASPDKCVVVFEQIAGKVAFADLGAGQAPDDRHAVGDGDQVESESPEEAGMRGAVAVPGVPGQFRTLRRLAGGGARHRRGVEQPQLIGPPGRGVAGQLGDHRTDHRAQGAQPLAVSGLGGQIREQAA